MSWIIYNAALAIVNIAFAVYVAYVGWSDKAWLNVAVAIVSTLICVIAIINRMKDREARP